MSDPFIQPDLILDFQGITCAQKDKQGEGPLSLNSLSSGVYTQIMLLTSHLLSSLVLAHFFKKPSLLSVAPVLQGVHDQP